MTILSSPNVIWAQTAYHVYIWIYSECLKKMRITVNKRCLRFENKLQNRRFGNAIEINLFGTIKECHTYLIPGGVQIILKKHFQNDWFWERLTIQKKKPKWLRLGHAEQMALISLAGRTDVYRNE